MTNDEQFRAMYTAEVAVVGSILIDPDCLGEVLTSVRAEDFPTERLRTLFEAARDLYTAGLPVDAVTVMERAGGQTLASTIRECMDETPTAANVSRYCEILTEQARLARMRDAASRIIEARTLDEARDILAEAQGEMTDRPGIRCVSLMQMMADFTQRMAQPKPDYLHWGLGMLDGMLHTGPGSYVIIAARPSTGKTALALQLGLSIARTRRVGFYSLETVPEVAGDRIAAANLGITMPAIKERKIDLTEMTALVNQIGSAEVFRGDFEFVSASSMSVSDIRAMALARRHEVVMIDYVQLIRPTAKGERTQQMQQVSMELRAMAQMTGAVIVALAQLRRPDSSSQKDAPTMADLKESGQFEQDADTVLLMYLDDPKNRRSDRRIKIEKNKEGYAGFRGRYRFSGEKQTFTPVDEHGEPLTVKFEELPDNGQEAMPDW